MLFALAKHLFCKGGLFWGGDYINRLFSCNYVKEHPAYWRDVLLTKYKQPRSSNHDINIKTKQNPIIHTAFDISEQAQRQYLPILEYWRHRGIPELLGLPVLL